MRKPPASTTAGRQSRLIRTWKLFQDLCDNARADSLATFANCESALLFKSNRLAKFDFNLNVVARHAHFRTAQ